MNELEQCAHYLATQLGRVDDGRAIGVHAATLGSLWRRGYVTDVNGKTMLTHRGHRALDQARRFIENECGGDA